MKNIVYHFLFLLLVSGMLFTGCLSSRESEVEDAPEVPGIFDDSSSDEEEEIREEEDEPEEEEVLEELEEVEEEENSAPPGLSITLPTPSEEEVVEETGAQRGAELKESADSVYIDGTYTEDASYQAPPGLEGMSVSLVIKDDVVTGVSVAGMGKDEVTKKYQSSFSESVSAVVVGKSLDELDDISAVNGASLTTNAFKKAVSVIKASAKS